MSLQAPQGRRQTLFQTSHSARCRDPQCTAENHATAAQRLERLLQANGLRTSGSAETILSQPESPLVESRATARRELIELACRWTEQYSSATFINEARRPGMNEEAIFLAGHQPEAFHPGVWYKNFVLDQITKAKSALGVNLLIDQDLVKTNALLVPTEMDGRTTQGRVAIDYGGIGIPFQERRVQHPDVMASVPERLKSMAARWAGAGLLTRWWPSVVEWSGELDGLGYGFAAARHLCELDHGSRTLEVPLSWICETASFAQFVVGILERMEDFFAAYNLCLDQYRACYGISGKQRPMPDLIQIDDWVELPFWLWTAPEPWRQRLVARREGGGWQLSVLVNGQVAIGRWRIDLKTSRAVEQLQSLASMQVRLRPRALMTTLYSRGVLAETFLHGIGGALYDQMTDRLASQVWEMRLPDYAIATATFHLVDNQPMSGKRQHQELQQRLRNQWFAPERLPEFATSHPQWVATKQELLEQIPPRKNRRVWQEHLESHLRLARQWQAKEMEQTKANLAQAEREVERQQWMAYREWSYLLYDEDLPTQLRQAAQDEFLPTLSMR